MEKNINKWEINVPFHVILKKNHKEICIPLPTPLSKYLEKSTSKCDQMMFGINSLELSCKNKDLSYLMPLFVKTKNLKNSYLYPWRNSNLNECNSINGEIMGKFVEKSSVEKSILKLEREDQQLVFFKSFERIDNYDTFSFVFETLDSNNQFKTVLFKNDINCVGNLIITKKIV